MVLPEWKRSDADGGIRLAVNGTIYTARVLWHPIPGSEAIMSRVPECGQRPEDPIRPGNYNVGFVYGTSLIQKELD